MHDGGISGFSAVVHGLWKAGRNSRIHSPCSGTVSEEAQVSASEKRVWRKDISRGGENTGERDAKPS